jgi:hypothetical protein
MYEDLAAGDPKAGLPALAAAAECWIGATVEEIAKPCCRFFGSLEADAMMRTTSTWVCAARQSLVVQERVRLKSSERGKRQRGSKRRVGGERQIGRACQD